MSCLIAFLAPIFLSPAPMMFLQLDEAQIEVPPDQETQPLAEEPAQAEPIAAEPRADAPTAQEIEVARSINDGVRQREDVRVVHRAFGIATWLSLGVATVIGGMTFHDEYGIGGPGDSGCAQRRPILNQDFCVANPPIPMLITGALASVLYYTTFTLSFMMPDPLGVASAPGWAGDRIRIHQALRWAHFAGMVLTTIFGAVSANLPAIGPDADFELRRAMAAVHLGLGTATFALLSAAAAVILF
jgi:hypothetical protein